MPFTKTVLFLLGSVATEIPFVTSCGDNWLLGADAAVDAPQAIDAAPVCDCPAAEPPLAGRFVVINIVVTTPANNRHAETKPCPLDTQLISGSCTVDNATTRLNVVLEQTGTVTGIPYDWVCAWGNYEPFPVRIRVSAVCLKLTP